MGACLSCLRGSDDDEQSINESTPLINEQRDYDKVARLKEREEQLNQIVNDTNDQLIDIQTFFNPLEQSTTMQAPEERISRAKLITNDYVSPEEKAVLKELHGALFDLVREDTTVEAQGPLVASFR